MNNLILPKEYLSYSQLRLWLDDKIAYRAKYYEGRQEYKSPELTFGAKIAHGLEDGSIDIANLIRYPVPEEEFYIRIADEVPFSAFIDQYWPEKYKFRETKTGKWPWTQKRVNEHMQLDIYSLCIQEREGQVDDECHLDWIITRNKPKFIEFEGETLMSESREIECTGEVVSFARVITQLERDRTREVIRTVAHEISSDYVRWLEMNNKKTAI